MKFSERLALELISKKVVPVVDGMGEVFFGGYWEMYLPGKKSAHTVFRNHMTIFPDFLIKDVAKYSYGVYWEFNMENVECAIGVVSAERIHAIAQTNKIAMKFYSHQIYQDTINRKSHDFEYPAIYIDLVNAEGEYIWSFEGSPMNQEVMENFLLSHGIEIPRRNMTMQFKLPAEDIRGGFDPITKEFLLELAQHGTFHITTKYYYEES